MVRGTVSLLALLIAAVLPSYATVVSVGGTSVANEGEFSSVAGATTVTFDSLTSAGPQSYSDGIATYSNLYLNQGVTPDIINDASPYADPNTSVGNLVVNFSQPIDYFGLYWGSPDATNTINFFDGSTEIFSLTGAQLNSEYGVALGDGNAAFVNFTAGPSEVYTRIVISPAGGDPFENDNQAFIAAPAAPTPEAGTGALTALGMVLTYFAAARRRAV
jgi:hypothetical protein